MTSRAILTGRPWRDLSLTPLQPRAALEILGDLDACDRREAALALGGACDAEDLLRGFLHRQQQGAHVFVAWSHRPEGGAAPLAVLGVDELLARGVGSAALLARPHRRWAGPLRALAYALRQDLPLWARATGFHRLEARSWAEHPTAGRLLRGIGFRHELRMRGFAGAAGDFDLYALSTDAGGPANV
ncbi:hypothetical protein [Albimonas pacifica]|uniref:Protein N-acetyltransferase, RimJ/RimL family n=1 Tax=Albimonas pacifica TaxID=1114924 RepID=A0A1I3JJS8_9RHOB|nr:hypothetical protein [Albimonas pacifica]SFI60522.1 hypothetical protein SAMN05216258_10838 [Albimonas pacifica]